VTRNDDDDDDNNNEGEWEEEIKSILLSLLAE
jgi:hypothetical protein